MIETTNEEQIERLNHRIAELLDEVAALKRHAKCALDDVAEWCMVERDKLGAVDGYDYRSGEEFGLRRAEIELRRRAKADGGGK